MRLDIRPAPATALTGLKASGVSKAITVTWTLPITDFAVGYLAAQIWVNTVNDRETATLAATVSGNTYTHPVTDNKTYYFWARAVNAFGRADGAFTGPASASQSKINSEDIGVFDLATVNILNKLSVGNITGLGALSTLDTVDVSKVNNLGALATADQIYANQIGAGTLAAGVVYAGTVNADKVNAGTFTGQFYRTASSGKRIEINNGGNNEIRFYTASDLGVVLGGSTEGMVTAYSGGQSAVFGKHTSSGFGVEGIAAGSGSGGRFDGSRGIWVNGGSLGAIEIMSGTHGIVQSGGGTNWLRQTVSASDASYDLGAPSNRWRDVFTANAVTTTSDERIKTDILDSPLGLSFINDLRPVSYRQKVAHTIVEDIHEKDKEGRVQGVKHKTTAVAGVRRHYGLIAQDVRKTLVKHGADNAAFWILSDVNDPNSTQALRYEELISPLIKAVQELTAELRATKEEVRLLKAGKSNM